MALAWPPRSRASSKQGDGDPARQKAAKFYLAGRSPARTGLVGVLGAAALLLVPAPASAEATISRDTITTPIFESGLPDDCRPGITGTLVGTDVFSFQRVDTALGFHIDATTTDTGVITWSDGSYTVVESVDDFSRNVETDTREFTDAHEDSGNTYTADGTFLFREVFHEVDHRTISDGVVRVFFEMGHIHFFEAGFC